jgi:hypothetical protein
LIRLSSSRSTQNQFKEKGATYIFNHVHLTLSYHKGDPKNAYTDGRILRARVQLASCDTYPCNEKSKPMKIPKPGKRGKELRIPYTYAVEFQVGILHQAHPLLSLVTPSTPQT